ncbi:MAG TPA: phosphodiester glycosidase family protein [Longimicrobium sp.]
MRLPRALTLAASALAFAATSACAQRGDGMSVSRETFDGAEWIVARADMHRVRLRMLSAGGAIGSYRQAEDALRRRGERMLLATNGGLFDGGPIGLHVEDGRVVRALNLDTVPPAGQKPGNFYYLPNAVLYQDRAGNVAIRDARRMHGRESSVRDGTQSGPALLLDGAVHRVARPPNRGVAHRNRLAACVTGPRELVIVFARQPTTFPQLARFLAGLGCRDAVFLDANVPGIYVPGERIDVAPQSFAGILTLTVPSDDAARP